MAEDNKMQVDQPEIDESLYSRQLYVLGYEAMKRMAASHILVIGLNGLGVEIAKNVCLAGVKSVTLYDPTPVAESDLGSQFFLTAADIGKRRDEVSRPRLAELNVYTHVDVLGSAFNLEDPATYGALRPFSVVVLALPAVPFAVQSALNDATHTAGIKFLSASTHGLFGAVFADFGPGFIVSDTTGEEPLSGMLVNIETDTGIVTCMDDSRHGLEDGDVIKFTEVQGLDVNSSSGGSAHADDKVFKVLVKGPHTFAITPLPPAGTYIRGGWWHQVKVPKVVDFKPLKESQLAPEFLITDFAKFDRPATLHVGFEALAEFKAATGALPRPRNAADAERVIELAHALAKTRDVETTDDVLTELAFQARGELAPVNAVIGGFTAQEVLKACSGKFMPLVQHLYFHALEALPAEKPAEADCVGGGRYASQVAVFGAAFQDKIASQRQFLVGSGAIGCEMLKNWAMMGLATKAGVGRIHVTDLDTIEKSNLNRQFLFRKEDLGAFKSAAARRAATVMNPELAGQIDAYQLAVNGDSENVFGDAFFDGLDGVTNALDNVAARRYMDERCVYYEKPLLESGTLGTKGNVQVVLPHVTESYSSSQDPPEKSAPSCTVHNFPNQMEHAIAWAKERFEQNFTKPAETVNAYLTQANFLQQLRSQGDATALTTLQQIRAYLEAEKPLSFEECIAWARRQFEDEFSSAIKQLLHSLPPDMLTAEGVPFWSPPKRCPRPLTFDATNADHLAFIISAANLHAYNYGLKGERDPAVFVKALASVQVPEFVPKTGVKFQLKDDDPVEAERSDADELAACAAALPAPSSLAGFRLQPAEFEKDDDTNFHMDFIAAASNLRASNYAIETVDKHAIKKIAGKIIPAIATTTALVAGLVCLELYKVIDGKTDIEQYKNGFVNLALPFFGFSEPIAAPKNKYYDVEWTLWDKFFVEGDVTLSELVDWFQTKHRLGVVMLSASEAMIYSSFMPKHQERLPRKLSELVETISKKPIPAHVKDLVFTVLVEDENEEDVDVPYLKVRIR